MKLVSVKRQAAAAAILFLGLFMPLSNSFSDDRVISSARNHPSPSQLKASVVSQSADTSDLVRNVFTARAVEQHQEELQDGRHMFGDSDSPVTPTREWKDDDFISRSVGVGNAGPDESSLLKNGDKVFQTVDPVFSPQLCQALVDEARQSITNQLKEKTSMNPESENPTNSDLGEARVSTLPKAREWLQTAMQDELMPLLESRFGCPAGSLTLQDALIIGYGYFGAPTISQPLHRDSCLLSLNVALSPSTDYVGGGTYFQGLKEGGDTLSNEQGRVLCHGSGALHAGRKIDSGERWVLVLFVLAADKPQIARRCHAYGIEAKRDGDLEKAREAMQTALDLAPGDHQYLTDLGGVYAAGREMRLARRHLAAAHFAYPPCYKASLGLGTMLLEQLNRPRAALRWFENALDRIGESDLKDGAWIPLRAAGWNVRVNAAKAALICSTKSRAFGAQYIPRAIQWIETCFLAAPDHPMLHGMLITAKRMQEENAGIEDVKE